MLNIDTIKDLFRHMEWADGAVMAAVLAHPDAAVDEKLMQCLNHIHGVQRVFLQIWRAENFTPALPEFTDARHLADWARGWYREADAVLDSIDGERLNQVLDVPWAGMVEERLGRKPETTTLGETALQVAIHTAYHRGQANARLRELGGKPPLVDYIAWVWCGRPEPEWP